MAEVFGLIASGAGLASLAIQLAESASILRDFYKRVQKAPKILDDVAFQLETLDFALHEIEQGGIGSERITSERLLCRCITACRRALLDIVTSTEKMQKIMSQHTIGGKMYIAMKGRDLRDIHMDLEQAKSSLLLALQLYTEFRRRKDAVDLNKAITDIGTLLTSQISQDTHSRLLNMGQEADPLQTIDINSVRRRSKRGTRQEYSFRLPGSFANRLRHLVLTWEQNDSTFGVKVGLRTFNLRPDDSAIFKCVRVGDIASVKALFASCKASPLDCLPDGTSLIELASLYRSAEMIRFLGDQTRFSGLWATLESAGWCLEGQSMLQRPFLHLSRHEQILSLTIPPYDDGRSKLELLRMLTERCDYDLAECFFQHSDYVFGGHPSALGLLSSTQSVAYLLSSLTTTVNCFTIEMRLSCARDCVSRADFLRICGLDFVTLELARARTMGLWGCSTWSVVQASRTRWFSQVRGYSYQMHLGGSFPITALSLAARAMWKNWGDSHVVDEWGELVRDLIINGAELVYENELCDVCETGCHMFATPLLELLCQDWDCKSSLAITLEKLRFWVALILDAGIDLDEYGAQESHRCQELRYTQFAFLTEFDGGFHISGFVYSAVPSEWSIIVESRHVVPLWKRVQRAIPGSWELHDCYELARINLYPPAAEILQLWESFEPHYLESRARHSKWRVAEHGLTILGEPCRIEEVIRAMRYPPIEDLVAGTQDDCGVVMLLLMRSRSTKATRRRPTSQRPDLGRRSDEYRQRAKVAHHKWLGDYHLCPSDGLYRVCKSEFSDDFLHYGTYNWKSRNESYTCKFCI